MTAQDLIKLREEAGLKQQQLGELLGYSGDVAKQTISKLETGKRSISRPMALAIKSVLSDKVKL